MSKDLDGIESIPELNVTGNLDVGGNLTVGGSFVLPSLSLGNLTLTDSTNQYRVNGNTFDLKSNSSTPVFSLKNNSDVTSSSTLVSGAVTTTTLNSTGISNSGAINTGSITTGAMNATTAQVTGAMASGSVTTGAVTGTTGTFSGAVSTGALTPTSVSTGSVTGTTGTFSGAVSTGALTPTSVTTGAVSGTTGTFSGAVSTGALTPTSVSTGSVTGTTGTFSGAVSTGDLNSTSLNVRNASLTSNLNDLFVNGNNATISIRPTVGSSANSIEVTTSGMNFRDSTPSNVMTLNGTTGRLTLANSTPSTSSNTGVLVTTGGIGITSTTDSISETNGGALTVGGGAAIGQTLRIGGDTRSTGRVIVSNTNEGLVDSNNASIYSAGGIKSAKRVVGMTGVVIPYGQALLANEGFSNVKILDVQFDAAGGLAGDATYLYTPGTGGNSSATYVLGANANAVRVPQTTAATSTTTGALRVAGGVGIGGNLHVGGTITGGSVSYSNTTSGTFTVTNGTGQTFVVDSTEASTTPTTGAARVKGGLGVEGNLNVGGTITGGSVSYSNTSSGTFAVTNGSGATLTVASTDQTSSPTTGAVTIAGGVGINRALQVAENITLGSTMLDGARFLSISNQSTGTNATAGLIFDTLGTGEAYLFMNGANRTSDGPANSLTLRNNSGEVRIQNSATKGLIINSTTTIVDQNAYVLATTASTSSVTGALRVDGGAGIQGDVFLGGGLTMGENSINGMREITFKNTNTGSSAGVLLVLDTAAAGSALIFKNGPNKTSDGGANTMTIRNDAGTVRLLSSSEQGLNITSTLVNSTKLNVTDNTISTSATTGSITTSGGIGAAGSIYAGAQVHALANTPSTSPTTGALRIVGGAGIGQNLNVGGNANITGETTLTGQVTAGPLSSTNLLTGAITATSLACSTFSGTGGTFTAPAMTVTQNTGADGTVAYFRNPNLGTTSQACIMVGGGVIANDRTARFGYVDSPNLAERRISLGYQGRDLMNIRTGGASCVGTFTANGNVIAPNLTLSSYGPSNFYEHGTLTPTLAPKSGTANVSYTVRTGRFTRVGAMYTIHFIIESDGFLQTSGTGGFGITGITPTPDGYLGPLPNPSFLLGPAQCEVPLFAKPYYATFNDFWNMHTIVGYNSSEWSGISGPNLRLEGNFSYTINQ